MALSLGLWACAGSGNEKAFGTPCGNMREYAQRIETLQVKLDSLQALAGRPENQGRLDDRIEALQTEKRSLQTANDKNVEACRAQMPSDDLTDGDSRFPP